MPPVTLLQMSSPPEKPSCLLVSAHAQQARLGAQVSVAGRLEPGVYSRAVGSRVAAEPTGVPDVLPRRTPTASGCSSRHLPIQASALPDMEPSKMEPSSMESPNAGSPDVGPPRVESSGSEDRGKAWAERCPIGEESPARREAWRQGWEYRKERGPGTPKMEVAAEMAGRPDLVSEWLEGFSTADKHFTGPEARPLTL
ncbi:hypothetical protein GGP42_001576 [Salinibacter ruber]|uniref:Uncharacterized protein n=1 Tax=Salinibacter ruber TaxID=146919 RepID=A0AAW5PBX9_9BACT|nr:hypothetical protein [Salinibacter ruber]MCS4134328.1 hypothetical protein [Salinibacter ruber]MCS4159442.1 hypothetical protein [Salinibacter ruber]MCS4223693.1 hypothetical protein [Salinibacter ruber]